MKVVEAITQRILDLCKAREITPNKLATLSGMPAGSLTSIFYGKSKNPGVVTIMCLCEGLGITLFEFFDDPLFKDRDLYSD